MIDHKPLDEAHLREEQVSGQQVFSGRLLDVRCDTVRLPNGHLATREYIVHPGAVMVVPILDDGRLVVERQYRYPLGRVMLEFPAGKLEHREPPLNCAVRELAEETGYRASEWARAGVLHNAIAYSSEGIEVWFARGLTAGARGLDDERIDARELLRRVSSVAACHPVLTGHVNLRGRRLRVRACRKTQNQCGCQNLQDGSLLPINRRWACPAGDCKGSRGRTGTRDKRSAERSQQAVPADEGPRARRLLAGRLTLAAADGEGHRFQACLRDLVLAFRAVPVGTLV